MLSVGTLLTSSFQQLAMASISGSLSSPPLLTAVPPKPPSGETRESLPVQQGGAKGASVPTRGSLTCRLHDGHSGARYRAGHLLRDPRRASLHGNPGLRRLARRRCSGSVKPKTLRAGSTFTFQFPSPWRLCLEGRRPLGRSLGAFVVPAQDVPRASGLLGTWEVSWTAFGSV